MEPYLPKSLPITPVNWEKHVANIAKANRHIARFDGILHTIPNPELLFAPIMTKEALLSSQIEGTQATLEDILQYDADPNEKISNYLDIQEVDNYRQTLQYAVTTLQKSPLTLNIIKEMHAILLDGVRGSNKRRGEFRKTQNWIGRYGASIKQASFIPPTPVGLNKHLSSFEKYFHFEDTERLVQLAVIHAQFELLHPFLDGNGRIGRILIPLFLYEKKLISHPSLYISGYLESHRNEYYDHLANLSSNNAWDDWIDFFLQALLHQARSQTQLANKILNLYNEMSIVVAECTRSYLVIKILDFIFSRPVFKSATFSQVNDISKSTTSRLLKLLVDAGILQVTKDNLGRAGHIYRFNRLIELLKASD